MAKFNGHKNYNHWNVALWINNDEGLYSLANECIRMTASRTEAARAMLQSLPERTPDGAPYSLSSVRAAMVGM